MITADLHAHTSFSSDSEEPMENALSAMVEKGLKTVCFTEHMDMDYPGGSSCWTPPRTVPAWWSCERSSAGG